MYEFGILALGGLITAKTVDFLGHLTKEMQAAVGVLLGLVVGVGYAFLFDFSLFAAWGIGVRSEAVGILATGLFMGSVAGVWHTVLGMMREWAHRYHGEASEIEARLHRAA